MVIGVHLKKVVRVGIEGTEVDMANLWCEEMNVIWAQNLKLCGISCNLLGHMYFVPLFSAV